MTDALISAALTLVLKVADKVALGTKAVDYLLGLEDPATRPFDSRLGVCFDHLCLCDCCSLNLLFQT